MKGEEDPESPADPETTQGDPSENEPENEAIEPQEELVPSAREEFNQAYAKMLQAADKDVADYARTLDSISYPVSIEIPLSPRLKSSC